MMAPAQAPSATPSPGRRTLRLGTSLLVGAALLAVVATGVDPAQVWAALRTADWLLLPPALGLLVLHYLCKGPRWAVLLSSQVQVSRWLAIRLTLVGFLFNNVLPARLGEFSRPWLLHTNPPHAPFPFAVATVLADKLFDLFVILVLLLLSAWVLPLPAELRTGAMWLAGVCLLGLGLILAATRWRHRMPGTTSARWRQWVSRLLGELAAGLATARSWRRSATALGYTLVAFGLLGGSLYLTMLMVGIHASLWDTMFIMGFLGVAFIIPAPPTQVGNYHFFVTEAVALLALADNDRALAFALLAHAIQVLTVTAGGLLSLPGLAWSAPPTRQPTA